MTRKHVITGWTSKRSRLTKLFRWFRWRSMTPLTTGDDQIIKTKGRKSDWCVDDWPPKRVRITVEEVKKRRKK